jgi:AAHS family 4-hydroxybenzoate transporter-like MFS transporter
MARDPETEFYLTEKALPGVPVKHLFTEGRAVTTLAIWLLFFLSFYLLWVLLSWTPTLLRHSGASVQQYSIAFALLNLGSFLTALFIGRLMDRFNVYNVLITTFIIAFFAVSIFGMVANYPFIVVAIMAVVTGLFVNGGNTGLMALCTISYPTSIRGSGVGWSYGVGKVGSMLGPVIGGILLARNWSVARICVVNGSTAVLIAAIIVLLKIYATGVSRKAAADQAGAILAGEVQ